MDTNEIEFSENKSLEQAAQIIPIQVLILQLDIEYLKAAAEKLKNQAHWQDSISVLNPGYNFKKSRLLEKKAQLICKLCEAADLIREIQSINSNIIIDSDKKTAIEKLFM